MRRILLRVAGSLVVGVVTLVLIDRAVGLIGGPFVKAESAMGRSSGISAAGTYLRPGFTGTFRNAEFSISIRINEQGLRGPDVPMPKPAGTHRILALGDSFTFGHGVDYEETWSARVAERLGLPTEVINAGESAYSPLGYARYLAARGLAFDPDVVLIGMFVGNDVVDDITERQSLTGPRDWLEHARYLHDLRLGPFLVAIRDLANVIAPNIYEIAAVAMIKAQYALGGHRTTFDYILADEQPAEIAAGWPDTLATVRSIATDLERRGVGVGVIVIPFYDQVAPTPYPPGYTKDGPQRRIIAYCQEQGLRCLDLLPVLREATDTRSLYFVKDAHWTRRGHDVASAAITEWILKEGLAPRR